MSGGWSWVQLPGEKAVRTGAEMSLVGKGKAASASSSAAENAMGFDRRQGLLALWLRPRKAVEELFVPLIWFASWGLADSLLGPLK